jgi:hypothetical protein
LQALLRSIIRNVVWAYGCQAAANHKACRWLLVLVLLLLLCVHCCASECLAVCHGSSVLLLLQVLLCMLWLVVKAVQVNGLKLHILLERILPACTQVTCATGVIFQIRNTCKIWVDFCLPLQMRAAAVSDKERHLNQ